jgi:hypothetical protein
MGCGGVRDPGKTRPERPATLSDWTSTGFIWDSHSLDRRLVAMVFSP